MDSVYVVINNSENSMSPNEIAGIFSTIEKAKKYIDETEFPSDYDIEEYEVDSEVL